jgi:predicted O-methyltransferase YrrM
MANIIFISFPTINFLPIFAIKRKALYRIIISYFKFLIHSTNQHGVHSPFVYNFITKCLYKKIPVSNKDIETIEENRNLLLNNNQKINVTDFGAGSKIFDSNWRSVSKIAKNAGVTKRRGKLLYNIVQYFSTEQILEIGTSVGLATTYLSIANSKAKIQTLEGCVETAKIAQNVFDRLELNNIKIVIGDFEDTLQNIINSKKYDLVYFDGNHQKNATIKYFEICLDTVHNETIFIFDDIHWSKSMELAWEYIKDHPKVTVSIDTFQWGVVFFRKEQVKEKFIIRV